MFGRVQVDISTSTPIMERPAKKPKTKSVSIKAPAQPKASSSLAVKATHENGRQKTQPKPGSKSNHKHETGVVPSTKAKVLGSISRPSPRLVVVSGSYDKILYGLQIDPKNPEAGQDPEFKPVFVFPAHISCVKAVAASPQGGKWLASGGTDEIIKVWDLRRKKELGSLQQHQG